MNNLEFTKQLGSIDTGADSKTAQEIAALQKQNAVLEQRLNTLENYVKQLAHDLKTPLTPLVGASELLASGINDQPWSELAQSIKISSENLLRMVDELLDLELCNCGMLTLNLSGFDPARPVAEEARKVEPWARPKRAVISLNLPGTPARVWADELRLRQVITIFLLDALKFSPAGGTVTVGVFPLSSKTEFRVEDTGTRIEDGDLHRIFEPYQAPSGQRRRVGSNSLALAKRLIELQGGKIGATSAAGNNTLWFNLPIEKSSIGTGAI
jgi:signal transduction histidine kinase